MEGDVVFTRDLSSGRIHKRYRTLSGQLATLEGCNLEQGQAGAYEVVDAEAIANADPGSLCENDFPDPRTTHRDGEDA